MISCSLTACLRTFFVLTSVFYDALPERLALRAHRGRRFSGLVLLRSEHPTVGEAA